MSEALNFFNSLMLIAGMITMIVICLAYISFFWREWIIK